MAEFWTILINAGLLVVTAIATLIAWRSARASKRSATEAEHEIERANRIADASREALQKSANALEAHNALLEHAMQPAPDPWDIEHKGGPLWAITNRTGIAASWVAVIPDGDFDKEPIRVNDPSNDIMPGGQVTFHVVDPTLREATIRIAWGNARNENNSMTKHLRFLP
jgi:hypothetical protein